jgi:hypothetical protein
VVFVYPIVAYLVVDEAPLLEEGVHAHNGADISSQIPPAGSDGQVLGRVEAVGVDHEVAVVAVDGGGLAAVAAVEELGQSLALAVVDIAHVEPGRIAGDDGRVCLRDEVRARSSLQVGLCGGLGVCSFGALPVFLLLGVVQAAHLLVVLAVGVLGIWSRAVRRIERVVRDGRRGGSRGLARRLLHCVVKHVGVCRRCYYSLRR